MPIYLKIPRRDVIAALSATYPTVRRSLTVTASISVSLYPDDGTDAETLFTAADTAMYHAKEQGRNNHPFYNREMKARAVSFRGCPRIKSVG